MSEAEHITDWGDFVLEEEERMNLVNVIEGKVERVQKLRGKWVLAAKGKSGETVYLQDRRLSKSRWWTRYLDCAIGFNNFEAASSMLSRLRYNNIRVQIVTSDMVRSSVDCLYSLL